jgi:hypothetical protein
MELTLLPPDSEMKEWSYTYPKMTNTGGKTLTMFIVITGFMISRLLIAGFTFINKLPVTGIKHSHIAADPTIYHNLYKHKPYLHDINDYDDFKDALDDEKIDSVVLESFAAHGLESEEY